MNIELKWIRLSLVSLAISGFYSIFIVMLRTPFLSSLFTDKTLFQTALIIHVDLSVLFWMVCFVMMIMTQNLEKKFEDVVYVVQNLLFLSVFLIFLSPFVGESIPLMNNYVPILHNLFFIIAIGIFFSSFLIVSTITCLHKDTGKKNIGILGILTCTSFAISAYKLTLIEYPMDLHGFYEMLFWGGGHILQFIYCAGLICALYEFAKDKIENLVPLKVFLILNTVFVIPMPFIQTFFTVDSAEYLSMFTEHMKIFGGIATIALIFVIVVEWVSVFDSNPYSESPRKWAAWNPMSLRGAQSATWNPGKYLWRSHSKLDLTKPSRNNSSSYESKAGFQAADYAAALNDESAHASLAMTSLQTTSLLLSLLLFLFGGVIALMIDKVNVTIPAHYHGSIVGISIAFMGYIYLIIDKNYAKINLKHAKYQLIAYFSGQLMHISALAYSGGYGALRKTPGVELPIQAKVAMGFMGMGGLIAIVAGLFFVYICYTKSIFKLS